MIVIRKITFLFIPLIFSFLLISCDDIFHDVSYFLEDVSKGNEASEPKRIFVGGNFSYTYNYYREAFYVLDGYGNADEGFLSSSSGVLGMFSGSSTGFNGVQDIEITDEYVYIGGNFTSNDTINADGTIDTDEDDYTYVQRYWLNGSFDTSYKPFSGIGPNFEIYGIEPLNDGTLMAGGNFTSWYTYEHLIRFAPDGTSSEYSPSPVSGGQIYSLEKVFEGQVLVIGGNFIEFNSDSGLDSLAIADSSSLNVFPSSNFSNMPSTTQVWDFASYGNQLFIAGTDGSNGVLFKYIYNGSTFTEDTTFNSSFTSSISANFFTLYTVSVDDSGRIYIGGNFSNQMDDSGFYHNYMMRIRSDGTIDWSFQADFDYIVYAIELQANGKVLVGGSFNNVSGDSSFNGLARVEEYGSIDYDFNSGSFPGGTVYAIAIEEDNY